MKQPNDAIKNLTIEDFTQYVLEMNSPPTDNGDIQQCESCFEYKTGCFHTDDGEITICDRCSEESRRSYEEWRAECYLEQALDEDDYR